MKMVEFTRDMRPHHAGDRRVVTDVVAEKLIAAGEAKPVVSVFDKATTPNGVRVYKTRKRG